jgi:type IV pilus assembly protein PilV
MTTPRTRRSQRGASMIEVLVALVVTLFGLFAMLGLNMRSYIAETESYQRSQALILVEDMAQRIRANRSAILDYEVAAGDPLGGDLADCSAADPGAERDLCEWENALRGASETTGGDAVGAISDAGRCIAVTPPAAGASGPTTAVITVVWRGTSPSGTNPDAPCVPTGYDVDNGWMRYVTSVVRLGDLDAN